MISRAPRFRKSRSPSPGTTEGENRAISGPISTGGTPCRGRFDFHRGNGFVGPPIRRIAQIVSGRKIQGLGLRANGKPEPFPWLAERNRGEPSTQRRLFLRRSVDRGRPLGTAAMRALGEHLNWDAEKMKLSSSAGDRSDLLTRKYRKGWEIEPVWARLGDPGVFGSIAGPPS